MPARVVVGGLAGLLVSGIRQNEMSRAEDYCEFNMVSHRASGTPDSPLSQNCPISGRFNKTRYTICANG